MIDLPQTYVDRVIRQLGVEAESFLHSYLEPRTYGLRINPLKVRSESMLQQLAEPFALTPVPWCPTGYYYEEAAKPGRHPYYSAGVYYIQEPSAMSSAELLNPQPGELVLDLAAAPGGKATQIAGKLNGRGLLIANEIHPVRAKALSENIERMGAGNCIVTCAAPDQLADRFPSRFDRIMLDAPCSGEGMFRKDPDVIREWSPEHVAMCAVRQADILDQAAKLLKPGGTLAYSTCTFNREENEDTIAAFLDRHDEFELSTVERIWPHREAGEGHFVAVLRKASTAGAEGDGDAVQAGLRHSSRRSGRTGRKLGRGQQQPDARVGAAELDAFRSFAAETLPGFALPPGEPIRFGDAVYWLPQAESSPFGAGDLAGLKVLRPGLHLFDVRKGRIEPAHALALALNAQEAARSVSFEPDDPAVGAYLRGETLPAPRDTPSGWTVVCIHSYPLGWGKVSGGQLKNHLPKGLRRPGL